MPARPANVPSDATFNEQDQEWELGPKNEAGQPVGQWRWWLPDGHLVCETNYDDQGQIELCTRYHQDGTWASKVTYRAGKPHGVGHYQASTSPTTEKPIPEQAPDNIFRMEYQWEDGEVRATRFWDVNGDEVDHRGRIIAAQRRGDIPADATFDDDDEVWVLAPTNADGDRHGIERRWRTRGTLMEESEWSRGRYLRRKLLHPDGSVARETLFDPATGLMTVDTLWHTDAETDIQLGRGGLDPRIRKVEYKQDAHGYLLEWTGWDADGTQVAHEAVNRSFDRRTEQTEYASLEEAASEWNAKGAAFYEALNAYVEKINSQEDEDEDEDEDEEPTDERGHMERFVLRALEKLNAEGRGHEARKLFSPSFEPFSETLWSELGRPVRKLCALDDLVVAWVGDEVYTISGDTIRLEPGVRSFGVSKDKRFFAKGYDDRIVISRGLRGETVKVFAYPQSYGPEVMRRLPRLTTKVFQTPRRLDVLDLVVPRSGELVVLVTRYGVFLREEGGGRLLLPDVDALGAVLEEAGDGELELDITPAHAALSPDDAVLAVSGQWGNESPTRYGFVLGGPDRIQRLHTDAFVFVGASGTWTDILSLDVTPDGKQILVGTNAGTIWRLSVADERGRGFLTNMNLKDERRYLFLRSFAPMIW